MLIALQFTCLDQLRVDDDSLNGQDVDFVPPNLRYVVRNPKRKEEKMYHITRIDEKILENDEGSVQRREPRMRGHIQQ